MTKALQYANISWSKTEETLVNTDYKDIYFTKNAIDESRHNFIKANNLAQRFEEQKDFSICELGFGSGLNFFLTAELWLQKNREQRLYYYGIDMHPWRVADLENLKLKFTSLSALIDRFIALKPPPHSGFFATTFAPNIQLICVQMHSHQALLQMRKSAAEVPHNKLFDCFFLDGFTPQRNSDMFDNTCIKSIASLAKSKATLSSYSATSLLKKNLLSNGFDLHKNAGFAGKREMICAVLQNTTSQNKGDKPFARINKQPKNLYAQPNWHLQSSTSTSRSISIIGAGVAGACLANYLAQRGVQTNVIHNQQPQSPPHIAIQAHISATESRYNQFCFNTLIYAHNYYKALISHKKIKGHMNGYWVLPKDSANALYLQQLADQYPQLLQWKTNAESKIKALYCQYGGHLQSQSILHNWLLHPSIAIVSGTAQNIQWRDNSKDWIIELQDGSTIVSDTVVLAAGSQTPKLLHNLPCQTIAGVGNVINDMTIQQCLHSARSIIPIDKKQSWVGSSYHLQGSPNVIAEAQNNRAICCEMIQQKQLDYTIVPTFIGHRLASKDYLPLIGAVANSHQVQQDFAKIGSDSAIYNASFGSTLSNIYLATGFGSKGFCYAPLCSAQLYSEMFQRPSPLPLELQRSLHPTRFIMRGLIKNKQSDWYRLPCLPLP